MMINLFKISIAIILWSSPALAMADLKEIKKLFTEKKVDEAIKLLKDHHKTLLKTERDYQELSRWLTIFSYDETMVSHEKALGYASTGRIDEADAEFHKALALEPYNKQIISDEMSVLIGNGRSKAALALITAKLLEQPYMGLYRIYEAHAQLLLEQKTSGLTCDLKGMSAVESQYCHYVQFLQKLDALTPEAKEAKLETQEFHALRNSLKRLKIPDAFYELWRIRGDLSDLKKYMSLCQSLSAKDKKIYRIVPGVCSKQEEANQKLKAGAQWQKSTNEIPRFS